MKINRIAIAIVATLACAASAQAENLIDIYQLALRNDPTLREAEANRMATLESKPQAWSSLLPQLSGQVGYGYTESSGRNTFPQFDPGTGDVQELSTPFDQNATTLDWRVDLRQSVFDWNKWVTLRTADKQIAQAEADFLAAQQDLMVRVATAYFDVLAAQDTLESEQASKEAIARQLEQAKKRFEVGLIAITDVQEAQAGYDQAVAAEIVAKRNLATRQEFLREIIGEFPQQLEAPADEIPLVMPAPAVADEWVDLALQENLSLLSSEIGAEIARDNIDARQAGHLPTLELQGSYNGLDSDAERASGQLNPITGTVDLGSFQSSDRDSEGYGVSLQLQIPIFSGGSVSSQARQATYEYRAARERYHRTARQTEREARDAYLGVESEIARVKALKQARESAQTALEASQAGFDVGTRTTVDVLDARRQVFVADVNYARSRYDYILNVLKLKQAAGNLTVDDIAKVNAWLQPAKAQ